VRLSTAERKQVEAAARIEGKKTAAWARLALLDACRKANTD
jgi:hypothetical protein